MEIDSAFSFMYSRLTADTQLMADVTAVYEDVAPANAAYPFVILSLQDAEDVIAVNLNRNGILCNILAVVVGLGTDMTRVKRASARMDYLLHDATGTQDAREVLSYRIKPYRAGGRARPLTKTWAASTAWKYQHKEQ